MKCKKHGKNHCDLHWEPPIGSPEQKAGTFVPGGKRRAKKNEG